jgi:hypothetical protein
MYPNIQWNTLKLSWVNLIPMNRKCVMCQCETVCVCCTHTEEIYSILTFQISDWHPRWTKDVGMNYRSLLNILQHIHVQILGICCTNENTVHHLFMCRLGIYHTNKIEMTVQRSDPHDCIQDETKHVCMSSMTLYKIVEICFLWKVPTFSFERKEADETPTASFSFFKQ